MEERSFINPFPDWDPSLSVSSDPAEPSGGNEPFDTDGKVRDLALFERLTRVCSMLTLAAVFTNTVVPQQMRCVISDMSRCLILNCVLCVF